MDQSNRFAWPPTQFWGLIVVLFAVFILGGSPREDVQSLAILNPLMVACSGVALLTLKRDHWYGKAWLAFGLVLVFFLVAVYILAIHPGSIGSFYAAAETNNIGEVTDVSEPSQPLLLRSYPVSSSFFFLFAPLAVVLFALQLGERHLRLALPILIAIGTISGVLGVLQLGGSAYGQLYLYRITNNSAAVGLFANRNHAAVFLSCLFPMLATFASRGDIVPQSKRRTRQLVAVALTVVLVPLVLITGSRSGLLTATAGLLGALLISFSAQPSDSHAIKYKFLVSAFVASAIALLVLVTIYFSRAEAVERIFAESGAAKDRTALWASSLALFWQYFPFGFGPGSFAMSFQISEPTALLDEFYVNRLHNDWLEHGLAFGIPGIILMLVGIVCYLRRAFLLWTRMDGARSAVALGRMASVIITILGIASVSDYPLRTPAMAGLAALGVVWLLHARRDPPPC